MAQGDFVDTDLLEEDQPTKRNPGFESRAASARERERERELPTKEEARKRLEEIRREQEMLEQQRLELEDLRRRQEEFEKSKTEIQHQLLRTIGSLENAELEINKQIAEINKQLTLVSSARKLLQEHTNKLENIREESWTTDDVRLKLQSSTEMVEEARNELGKARQALAFIDQVEIKPVAESVSTSSSSVSLEPLEFDFWQEVKRGAAWTLPLIAAIVVAAILFAMLKA
ncbi:MAG: hypothetical protein JO317_04080 [Verrucomicrobiae bacterium]|nr:hypothetical protein [Verrucomicrobiae bacterium]